jgi:hypothetical protein
VNFKKILFVIGFLIIGLSLFLGVLFRISVKYAKIAQRDPFEINDENFKTWIDKNSPSEKITNIDEIIDLTLKLTSKRLAFTSLHSSNDPNINFKTGKANCVGYAAFFNIVCNYLLKLNNLENDFHATHLVGNIEWFGFDLHQLNKSPIFKDHDFNTIIDRKAKKKKYVDPSLYDYFWIKRVSLK